MDAHNKIRRGRQADNGNGFLFALLFNFLVWFVFLYAIWPEQDFTDSGVGCINDCLDIQDEADTLTSKERN